MGSKKPDLDGLLKSLASEAEKAFKSEQSFSNNSSLARTIAGVHSYLDKYCIGPAVLSLLVVFAFAQKRRKKIWIAIKESINNKTE